MKNNAEIFKCTVIIPCTCLTPVPEQGVTVNCLQLDLYMSWVFSYVCTTIHTILQKQKFCSQLVFT